MDVKDNNIEKFEIMDYGFYEDSKQYVVVLNREKLKKLFGADKVIFEEVYR